MNSIISSSLGHGSINVGDSIGSAFAQLTLILGITALSLRRFEVNKKEVFIIGIFTLLASILSFLLILDSYISRVDGFFLICSWVLFVLIIRRIAKKDFSCPPLLLNEPKLRGFNVLMVILGFIGVAIGTYLVINSIFEITQIFNIFEFIAGFLSHQSGPVYQS